MSSTENPSRPSLYKAGFETYLSPYTHRYGSEEMRRIWSRKNYWQLARSVWANTAEAQAKAGLITPEELTSVMQGKYSHLSVERIDELEKELGHDILAGVQEFSERAPLGGKIIHRGLTSEDVLSNVEAIQIHESMQLIRKRLKGALQAFAWPIMKHADYPTMGFTHLQAAEPTTVGYRFAKYAQDLLMDLELLDFVDGMVKGKGIKGPVGTSASVEEVLGSSTMTVEEHEEMIMHNLDIDPTLITDQTAPRKYLFLTEVALSSIAQSLHRFSWDMRILQSSPFGEVSEPRRKKQKGSSAMPHKQNPIIAENIGSLTMSLPGILSTAWTTGATVTLERALTDSAGKRAWLPESFLAVEEALLRTEKIMNGLVVHLDIVDMNFKKFAPFAATEPMIELLVRAGMDRKEAHDLLVEHAEEATDAVRRGNPNPLKELVLSDSRVAGMVSKDQINEAFDKVGDHVGNAPELCRKFVEEHLEPALA